MNRQFTSIAALGLALAPALLPVRDAQAAAPGHWVASWYAAPQPAWDSSFILPMNVPDRIGKASLRETLRLSLGGRRIRLVFSNRYGREPVPIGEVRVALAGAAGEGQALRFSGSPAAAILPGATLTSDPLVLSVPALARLTVTSQLPAPVPVASFHWGAQQTVRVMHGSTAPGADLQGRLFLSAVLVEAMPGSRTVVALGDSITDGNGSTPGADRRWPDLLAQRLAPHGIAVVNAGISGGRLLRDGMGRSALARFEQDVLSQPGVSDVIVLLGVNDIGWPGSPFAPDEPAVSLGELQAGFRQLLAAAHARGLRLTVGTVTPFEGALEGTPYAGHYSPAKEQLRQRLNAWIRSCGLFDEVVDFDAVLRDPARPQRMRAAFDSGDHLHPGDAGYRAMAEAIALAPILRRPGQTAQTTPAEEGLQ